ncbi:proline-rich extensin-like protein EPR1 isoform X2 [Hyalella azteca]|uniref:Proline-rich extensin-like protein EPR1 isoform X2 n=1 Tax=Hyalella azteca TaxID=294128 RepID=A0A8B7P903_HYAAZ|nr:proline-rich extensin-like protein EPR1 isoform X2 [Hyalella azteca]
MTRNPYSYRTRGSPSNNKPLQPKPVLNFYSSPDSESSMFLPFGHKPAAAHFSSPLEQTVTEPTVGQNQVSSYSSIAPSHGETSTSPPNSVSNQPPMSARPVKYNPPRRDPWESIFPQHRERNSLLKDTVPSNISSENEGSIVSYLPRFNLPHVGAISPVPAVHLHTTVSYSYSPPNTHSQRSTAVPITTYTIPVASPYFHRPTHMSSSFVNPFLVQSNDIGPFSGHQTSMTSSPYNNPLGLKDMNSYVYSTPFTHYPPLSSYRFPPVPNPLSTSFLSTRFHPSLDQPEQNFGPYQTSWGIANTHPLESPRHLAPFRTANPRSRYRGRGSTGSSSSRQQPTYSGRGRELTQPLGAEEDQMNKRDDVEDQQRNSPATSYPYFDFSGQKEGPKFGQKEVQSSKGVKKDFVGAAKG